MEYRSLKLNNNKETIVDIDTYEWAKNFKWYINNSRGWIYVRRAKQINGKRKFILLHREILNVPNGVLVDHINGNTLDNRKQNLRICNAKDNSRNRRKGKNNFSGYKGVSWYKRLKKWMVRIKVDGKDIHLGLYSDLIYAARIYDEAAIKYHGKFANLNFKG